MGRIILRRIFGTISQSPHRVNLRPHTVAAGLRAHKPPLLLCPGPHSHFPTGNTCCLFLLFTRSVVSKPSMTSWTVAHQARLSMEFSRQEYWSGVVISFSRGSSRPRDQTCISCLIGGFFTTEPPRKPKYLSFHKTTRPGTLFLESSSGSPQTE